MKTYIVLVNLLLLNLLRCGMATVLDTSEVLLSRQKRFLIYQEGTNWVQMIVGIGLPIELKDHSITWGIAAKSYYLLPTNSSDVLRPSIDIGRGKRSTSRWKLYSAIQHFAERMGFGSGKACLLRAICEVAATPLEEKSGLLSEILHVILTPSCTDEMVESHRDFEYHAAEKLGKETDNCAAIFPECRTNLLTQFSKTFM